MREGEVLHIPSRVEHQAEALEDTFELDVFSPIRQAWLDLLGSPRSGRTSPFRAARFGSRSRGRLRKYSASGRSSVSSGPGPTKARISFGPAVNVSSSASNVSMRDVLHALGAPGHAQLPLEILPPQPQRLDRADEQRSAGPGGRLGEHAEEGAGDQVVLGFGAGNPLHHDAAGFQHAPHQLEVLAGIQVARAGKDGLGDVGGDDVVALRRQHHEIAPVVDAEVHVAGDRGRRS